MAQRQRKRGGERTGANYLGDIAISPTMARANARRYGRGPR